MSSCDICGTPLRSDNRSGICARPNAACRTERKRREALRPGGSGLLCLCSHGGPDHPGGACIRWCGCEEWRLDARSRIRDESSEGESTARGAA